MAVIGDVWRFEIGTVVNVTKCNKFHRHLNWKNQMLHGYRSFRS